MINKYEVRGNVTIVILEKNGEVFKETKVDTNDLEKLLSFSVRWFAYLDKKSQKYYVRANLYERVDGVRKTKTVQLHRFLTDATPDKLVDHFDGDTLNNRTSVNLRIVTALENQQNRKIGKNNKSGMPGVLWVKRDQRWKAVLKHEGKLVFQKNCRSYDEAVLELTNAKKKFHPNYNEKRHA